MNASESLRIPHVWRVPDLAVEACALPTGHAALDAQLPGGGWPVGSLVELLQERPEAHAWQLLLPALAQTVSQREGPVVVVGAPLEPFGPALSAQGLPAERLLWIRAEPPPARLWSAEQSLRCHDVRAVLAWLPQVRTAELRRLHLAARQHGKLLFVLRPQQAALQASPAPLRLVLHGSDTLQVRIVKRRGPPMDEPIALPAWPARMQALLDSRRRSAGTPVPQAVPTPDRRSHVLDRLVPQP